MEFKDVLKQLRLEEGISQDKLADKLKLSRSCVGMYEQGRRQPKLEDLEEFADFFNVDVAYLLGKQKEKRLIPLVSNNQLPALSPAILEELSKLDERKQVLVLAYLKAINGEV